VKGAGNNIINLLKGILGICFRVMMHAIASILFLISAILKKIGDELIKIS
jgi:hypothetical protein